MVLNVKDLWLESVELIVSNLDNSLILLKTVTYDE